MANQQQQEPKAKFVDSELPNEAQNCKPKVGLVISLLEAVSFEPLPRQTLRKDAKFKTQYLQATADHASKNRSKANWLFLSQVEVL